MALRKFAAGATSRLGIRVQPAFTTEPAFLSLRVLGARAYATVLDGLSYAESHEWAKLEGDTATIGISDFAQAELGDIVYVELPEVGSEVEKGKTFGVVESVKAASDVYSPISGEVTEVNSELADDPAKVNKDAFGDGWLMKIKVSDASEADSLLDKAAYEKLCEEKSH